MCDVVCTGPGCDAKLQAAAGLSVSQVGPLLCACMHSGSVYPLEAHLVSVVQQSDLPACPASGCIVVMAVMFELADQLTQDNTWLALLFDQMPYKEGVSKPAKVPAICSPLAPSA